jgi:hypothetical protein
VVGAKQRRQPSDASAAVVAGTAGNGTTHKRTYGRCCGSSSSGTKRAIGAAAMEATEKRNR